MKHFFMILVLCVSALLFPANAQSGQPFLPQSLQIEIVKPDAAIDLLGRIQNQEPKEKVFNAACCKICHKGKACGDSCISRSYTCHKGPGCACDG